MAQSIPASRLASLLGPVPTRGPAYQGIAEGIRLLVVDGRVSDGSRLPSERELAAALGVSRTTTARVYSELRASGMLQSRQGSGSIVSLPYAASSASSMIVTPDSDDTIALTYAAQAAPSGLGRAFESALTKLPGLLSTTGYLPDGLPVLRELLAERYNARGLPTDPEQIVITSGALGGISLLARTLLGPGRRVVVEGVSYPHAHESFAAVGSRLSALPIADSPWDPTALASTLRGASHRAAYLIPDFHNPTGEVMTDDERGSWARELRRHDVVPIVDESLRDLNLDGVDLPRSYASYDPRAVLVDSASKSYWGGLRIGWIRAPRGLVMPLIQARMSQDLGSAAFEQLVLAELLTEGGQTAAAARSTLRSGRDHLLAELAEVLPEVEAPCPAGGLSLWLTLPDRVSSQLTAAASRHGLLLTPGPRFFSASGTMGERHLRVPFTQSAATLTEAVARLRSAYDEVLGNDRAAPAEIRSSETLELIA
ncbi:MAG: PLP-dependent aminotransferase family protein [Aeromicrobium sp.]